MGLCEVSTVQLVSIWFVLGAIAAAASCIFTSNIPLQIGIFLAVSVLALVVTRPFVRKITNRKPVSTNSDRYIGETGEVTVEINNLLGQGQIVVNGSVWTARSTDDAVMPVGRKVLVEDIQGVKLMVKPI